MPIFTVTASDVPGVGITVRSPLSVLPAAIVMVVAPPSMLPFVTVTGSTILKGAPVGAVALNWFPPTFSRDIVMDKPTVLSPR